MKEFTRSQSLQNRRPCWCFLLLQGGFDLNNERVDNPEFEPHTVTIADMRNEKSNIPFEVNSFEVFISKKLYFVLRLI